jgi:hypothetical protein
MGIPDIYAAVKRATVAVVLELPNRIPARPFTIIGSGFCIHPEGVVVTCEHVFRAFVDPAAYQRVMDGIKDPSVPSLHQLRAAIPHAMFFAGVRGHEITMFPVPIVNATTKPGHDLAVFKLQKHAAFSSGYPTLPIADYDELHEMMEIGICGFPLGERLQDALGTLDATATNGNSGGPVFSLTTGKAFGVLTSGAIHPDGYPIGLAKAEPIYPVFEHDLVARMAAGISLPTDASGTPESIRT